MIRFASSHGAWCWRSFPFHPDLLNTGDGGANQLRHLFLRMFEMGSLLQHLAKEYGRSPLQLFGSLKNFNQRLLECFRYFKLGEETFASASCQIRLVDSS